MQVKLLITGDFSQWRTLCPLPRAPSLSDPSLELDVLGAQHDQASRRFHPDTYQIKS
jgi:hypothetical protein